LPPHVGFGLGFYFGPARISLDSRFAADNALLRQQIELCKKMVEIYEAERAAIKDAEVDPKSWALA
jgi:hypothetical protein